MIFAFCMKDVWLELRYYLCIYSYYIGIFFKIKITEGLISYMHWFHYYRFMDHSNKVPSNNAKGSDYLIPCIGSLII